jgi:hyperosmotically inducible protein
MQGSWRRFAAVGLLALVGGCATVDRTEDMRIESEVKARLVAQQDANLTRLGVVSTNAVVSLSGVVESTEQRAQAGAVAKGVRGVKRVVNALEIRPPSR